RTGMKVGTSSACRPATNRKTLMEQDRAAGAGYRRYPCCRCPDDERSCTLRSDRPTHPRSHFVLDACLYACYPRLVNGYFQRSPLTRPPVPFSPRGEGDGDPSEPVEESIQDNKFKIQR